MTSKLSCIVIYLCIFMLDPGQAGDCDTLAVFIDESFRHDRYPLDGMEFSFERHDNGFPVFYNRDHQYMICFDKGCPGLAEGWTIHNVSSAQSTCCTKVAGRDSLLYLTSGPAWTHPADIDRDSVWKEDNRYTGFSFTGVSIECQDSGAPSFTAEITMSLVVISVCTALILLRRCCRCRNPSVGRRWTERHHKWFPIATLNCAACVLLLIATFSVHWVVQRRVEHHGLFHYCTPRRCEWNSKHHAFSIFSGLRAMQALMICSSTASLVSAIIVLICVTVKIIRQKKSVVVLAALCSFMACAMTTTSLIVFNTAKKLDTPPSASYGIAVLGLASQTLSSVLIVPRLCTCTCTCTCTCKNKDEGSDQ